MKRVFNSCTKMWIDGICFEMQRIPQNSQNTEAINKYKFERNEEGKLFTSFQLPPIYYEKLRKFPDFNLNSLEKSTETIISLPVLGKLTITGENEEKITSARDEIHEIICKIRKETKPLQFISIPTISDEITNNFKRFKEDILSANFRGIEESVFQKNEKLHLTITVSALLDEREIAAAVQALKNYKETLLQPALKDAKSRKIQLSGVNAMNNNYEKVHVLYANAKFMEETENFTLQKIANQISDYFHDQGLIKEYKPEVKLHMTLINTKYRKNSSNSRNKRWKKQIPIDATSIMEKYKNYEFGICDFNNIQLSLMGSVGPDGYYKAISTEKF